MTLAGLLTQFKVGLSRKGTVWAKGVLEDQYGCTDLLMFGDAVQKFQVLKKKSAHKRITLKTHSLRSKQQPAESLLVNVNHTGSSELARPRVERQELSLAAQNRTRTSGDKLPPDFLGTAAYLLVAEKMSLGPELLQAAGLGAIGFQEHMQSKDGLERLAISQLLVTHGRVMWLSTLLTEQANTKAICANQCVDR